MVVPIFSQLEVGDDDETTDSPYIKELIAEHVRYVQYSKLITTKELGHVSAGVCV